MGTTRSMFQSLPTVRACHVAVSAQLAPTVFNDSDRNERADIWTMQEQLKPGQFPLIMYQVVGKKSYHTNRQQLQFKMFTKTGGSDQND